MKTVVVWCVITLCRRLEDGTEERKSLNETRIGAQIQLSKPLDRLLASQIDYKEWYDLTY